MFDNIIERLLSAIVEFWIWLITSNRNASEEEKWWKQNVRKSENSFSVYMGGTYKMSTGWINMILSLIFFFENYFVICIYVTCGKNICFFLSINVVCILLLISGYAGLALGPIRIFFVNFSFSSMPKMLLIILLLWKYAGCLDSLFKIAVCIIWLLFEVLFVHIPC